MNDSIEWSDPPARGGGSLNARGRIDAIVAELKLHPGRWAKVRTNVVYRKQMGDAFQIRGCEVITRKSTEGDGKDHYARWPVDEAQA